MTPSRSLTQILCAAGLVPLLGLAGCAMQQGPTAANSAATISSIAGNVHGGQQPISGATVRVIAPGRTGYGSAGTVLSQTTSDAGGGFKLPPYLCPADGGLVYLTATGGNAGSGINSFSSEAAVLGPCTAALQASYIQVNEVTTAAAAYALAPFASIGTSSTSIGTSATNLTGLNNTYNLTNLLAPLSTGTATGATAIAGMLMPQQELNSLANTLAACINSSGSTASGTSCGTLLADTTTSGATPIDTFQAAISIALHPASNVSSLYMLSAANPPFQPALTSSPNDWSLPVGYAGANIGTTSALAVAIDATGNAWVVSGSDTSSTERDLTQITPAGTYSTTVLDSSCGPAGLAIGTQGYVVVSCGSSNQIQVFVSGRLTVTQSPGSLKSPAAIAFDAGGNLWVANAGSSATGVTELINPLGLLSEVSVPVGSPTTSIAADPSAIWTTTNSSGTGVAKRIDYGSHAVTQYAQVPSLGAVALDGNGNYLSPAQYFQSSTSNSLEGVLEVSDSGTLLSPSTGYPGVGNILIPNGIAVDGLGNIITSSFTAHQGAYHPGALQIFTSSGTLLSGSTGLFGTNNNLLLGVFLNPMPIYPTSGGLAVDGSGNVWVAGNTGSGTVGGVTKYVTLYVGLAAPVLTPTATAVVNNTVGTRP